VTGRHLGNEYLPENSLSVRDGQAIAGMEKLRFFPLAVGSGRGSVLVEPGGRELLDFSSSWTAAGLGHGNPEITAAIARAAADPPGASILSATHPEAVALAEELLALVPTRESGSGERRVYLGHAGTDANDVAIRGCRHATGKPGVIAFEGGYHGGLGVARRVSGVHVESGVPADPHVTFVPYPDPFRRHTNDSTTVLADVLAHVCQILERGKTAAVIVEPIQSDGGLIVPPQGFLRGLRALCDAHGTYLIVDEVKVGLGRTGHLHAFEQEGISPDIVTLGKVLGGGLPLSAAIGPADVLDRPTASALMTTTGNPICCAAGRAVLGIVRNGVVVQNAAERGQQIRSLLGAYKATPGRSGTAHIGDVRGRGLSIGIELVTNRKENARDPELAAKVAYRAWELGLVVYPVRGNVLEITPALTVSTAEVEQAMEILTSAIDDAALGIVSDEQIAPYTGW
jgi:4-aminobutyrate aminotransferase